MIVHHLWSSVKLLHQGNPWGDRTWREREAGCSLSLCLFIHHYQDKMPSHCSAILLCLLFLHYSFNVGTHPSANEDWLLSFFCRCVIFSPSAVIKCRPVNDSNKSLQNVTKNKEGALGQQFERQRKEKGRGRERGRCLRSFPNMLNVSLLMSTLRSLPAAFKHRHPDAKWGKEAAFKRQHMAAEDLSLMYCHGRFPLPASAALKLSQMSTFSQIQDSPPASTPPPPDVSPFYWQQHAARIWSWLLIWLLWHGDSNNDDHDFYGYVINDRWEHWLKRLQLHKFKRKWRTAEGTHWLMCVYFRHCLKYTPWYFISHCFFRQNQAVFHLCFSSAKNMYQYTKAWITLAFLITCKQ